MANAQQQLEAWITWQEYPLNAKVIADLTVDWADLAQHCTEPNVFLEPWFVQHTLHLLEGQETLLFCTYDGDTLVGLLPLQRACGYAKLPLCFLKPALHAHQFLATPLVRKGFEHGFATALCDWLDKLTTKDCFILMTHLAGDGPVSRAISEVCQDQNRRCTSVNNFDRASIDCSLVLEAANTAPLKRSKSNKRKLKQLQALGPTCVETLQNPADLMTWTEDFLRLENLGWKGAQSTSILSCPTETTFYRHLITSAMSKNALEFRRLTIDGKAIAYTLDLVSSGEAFCLKGAYDPDFAKYSPGVLLEQETLTHYLQHPTVHHVDSCAAPDHPVLNNIWDQRKVVSQLLIAKQGDIPALTLTMARILEKTASRFKAFKKMASF